MHRGLLQLMGVPSGQSWQPPPALGAGHLTLCAGVGGLSSCDRREGQQCLPLQCWAGAEVAGAAEALGRGCTTAWAGARAATKGLCLEKEWGRLRNREPPDSLPEFVTRSCSSVFFIPRVARHL